jgi:hypothetical protein
MPKPINETEFFLLTTYRIATGRRSGIPKLGRQEKSQTVRIFLTFLAMRGGSARFARRGWQPK